MSETKRAHVAACRHAPIRTAYGPDRGTDRVVRTYQEALALALRRAPERGRQMVRQHTGWLLKRVWVVQDAAPAPAGDSGGERG